MFFLRRARKIQNRKAYQIANVKKELLQSAACSGNRRTNTWGASDVAQVNPWATVRLADVPGTFEPPPETPSSLRKIERNFSGSDKTLSKAVFGMDVRPANHDQRNI